LDQQYDCVDRIVLNAYFDRGQSPGGFRTWWQTRYGTEDNLDNAHLMRMAGRFRRRVRGWAQKNGIPVLDCTADDRKHELAEALLPTQPRISLSYRHSSTLNWPAASENPEKEGTILAVRRPRPNSRPPMTKVKSYKQSSFRSWIRPYLPERRQGTDRQAGREGTLAARTAVRVEFLRAFPRRPCGGVNHGDSRLDPR
jgi:hypothetical protein